MLRLSCIVQNYEWGQRGRDSEVARLHFARDADAFEDDKPYAELWMGTHPNGPSACLDSGEPLKKWIQNNIKSLGSLTPSIFGSDLPFLLKVLSIETALSIQSHPDKTLAEKLHYEYPEIYKDPNHKPEMAIAIDKLEALCGFVTTPELRDILYNNTELCSCIDQDAIMKFLNSNNLNRKEALKSIFKSLMTCSAAIYKKAIIDHVARLKKESALKMLSEKEKLVLSLNEQYPEDIGVLASYFLNYLKVPEGRAVYFSANEPHAYIHGNIIECMATSDNVIRAGLTPKARDVKNLCNSLTYSQGLPGFLEGDRINKYLKCYRPPFQEFEVLFLNVPTGHKTKIHPNKGPMIMLIHQGYADLSSSQNTVNGSVPSPSTQNNLSVNYGDVLFIPAETEIHVNVQRAEVPLKAWIACVNRKTYQSNYIVTSNILSVKDGQVFLKAKNHTHSNEK